MARSLPSSRLARTALVFLAGIVTLWGVPRCASPSAPEPHRVVNISPDADDPRYDTLTAVLRSSIRFEAVVDTLAFPLRTFSGSGLRLAVVCFPPSDTSSLPYLDLCSFSANYLDVPATGLPFRAVIPASYFKRYTGTRIAAALVVLYRDTTRNGSFDEGEPVLGVSEQSLFAYAEGKLKNLPTHPFGPVRDGPNVLVRSGQQALPPFKPAPDYGATIFLVYVRGEMSYNIPYPWPVRAALQQAHGREMSI